LAADTRLSTVGSVCVDAMATLAMTASAVPTTTAREFMLFPPLIRNALAALCSNVRRHARIASNLKLEVKTSKSKVKNMAKNSGLLTSQF
jgi:hypothetical protein